MTGYKTEVLTEEYGIAKGTCEVVTVYGASIEEAKKVIDYNNKSKFIITDESKKPHEIIIDMKVENAIRDFSYLPPQGGKKEGIIYEYEFYTSKNGTDWGKPVAVGTLSNIENNPNKPHIKFNNKISAKFIKLVSLSTMRQDGTTSITEIEIDN